MTAPAQTALDFCCECLGWEDAEIPNGATSVFDRHGRGRFNPSDLNAVISAAKGWCDKVEASLVLGYGRYAKGDWDASIMTSAGGGLFLNRCPCRAILAACVEAARKLKATA